MLCGILNVSSETFLSENIERQSVKYAKCSFQVLIIFVCYFFRKVFRDRKSNQTADRQTRLQGIAEVAVQHRQQRVQVLAPQRAIGAVGQPHLRNLRRAQAEVRVLKLDQRRT